MIRPRVTHEWGRLREVIVGRPHYRLPDPMPEDGRAQVSERTWRRACRFAGKTLAEAMPADFARCREQMDHLVGLLRAHDIGVHRVPPFLPREEDYLREQARESILLFPRDPLLVVGGRVIELTMRDVHRRRERFPLRRLLRRVLASTARVSAMPEADTPEQGDEASAFLDGGDGLLAGDTLYVGAATGDSTEAGVDWLRRTLGSRRKVEAVPYDGDFPHLDCTLCLIRPGLGLFCPDAIPEGPPASLAGWRWLEVSRDEAISGMATNGIQLDANTLVLADGADPVAARLRALGLTIHTVPFDAITNLGGGPRCWSQPLVRWG